MSRPRLMAVVLLGYMAAQGGPVFGTELALGPSWLRSNGDEVPGGALAATWRSDRRLAFVLEASLHLGDAGGENLREMAVLVGPRLSPWVEKRLRPFLALKVGGVSARRQVEVFGVVVGANGVCQGSCSAEFGATGEAGGGLDLGLTHRITLRLPEAEYRLSRIAGGWKGGLRVSAGVVARW
jgi:hypothetical protein